MSKRLFAGTGFAFLFALLPIHAKASDCDGNFVSSGNILTGKTYKTIAALPNVTADSAYQSVYLSIAKQGFVIQQSDSTARVVSARANNSAPGREAPLNATVEPSQGGATITLTFATPAGAFSPENSIRDEFCKIVQAAAVPQQETARSPAPQSLARTDDSGRATGRTDSQAGRMCLANACIGMTLDEAAKLLKPQSTKSAPNNNFSSAKERRGFYGLDANGKLVSINSFELDRVWIRQFAQTIHTMCVVPPQLGAEISSSDGTPISLAFFLSKQNGKVQYVLSSISRALPNNMSASESKNFENEVRNRYGRGYVETADIGRAMAAYNGQLQYPVAMIHPGHLELRGPATPGLAAQLLEQPGCSNKINLD